MSDAVILFSDELQSVFGPLDWLPDPDGQIHRFHVPGDRSGSRNGWYVLHLDGIAFGLFGSWKAGGSQTWSSRQPADPLEARLIEQRIEQARRQREAERQQRQQLAAVEAQRLWSASAPAAADHPYLSRKEVKPHNARQLGSVLLVPLYHAGRLVNLQRIYPDGGKRFLPGARVTGAYSPLGRIEAEQRLYLCEGWATGATIHEHTGAAVACAMNAGNLYPAGDYLRRRYPEAVLIVAGDDDRQTEGNPGRTKANHAAALLGCGVVFPAWTDAEPLSLSDFNDLRQWREAHP
ncbi:putative DNA primase/helicase [Azotobacter beijerinckii]|uniref:Putative DNA primase/helicase n=1 Tax=Azotobacter beijerinckii TaxID=170623 RepID=A0A1H7A092_9GAMM|nr:toprim domain-containing protein [Azotobacter beijerinckii]SEJ57854.1 putative DNA primase/helicase [Azotobacter beijerinckii]